MLPSDIQNHDTVLQQELFLVDRVIVLRQTGPGARIRTTSNVDHDAMTAKALEPNFGRLSAIIGSMIEQGSSGYPL